MLTYILLAASGVSKSWNRLSTSVNLLSSSNYKKDIFLIIY